MRQIMILVLALGLFACANEEVSRDERILVCAEACEYSISCGDTLDTNCLELCQSVEALFSSVCRQEYYNAFACMLDEAEYDSCQLEHCTRDILEECR